jgi:hypothetical protein
MKHFAFFLALALLSTSAFAQESFDWPQWQGPDRNAISKERGLLQTWPEKGPPLVWRAKGIVQVIRRQDHRLNEKSQQGENL